MTNAPDEDIIEEIRRRRQAHAETFGYDLKQIIQDLQRQEKESGEPVVERPPREPEVTPKRSSA